MRTITATEASRSFAELLDNVEGGETVIITRAGRRIATVGPAITGNGREVRALIASRPDDDQFAADVMAARDAVVSESPAWPVD
jgi:prevent-host-death family protein